MRIAVINEKNSDNIGDQAISEAMERALTHLGHEVHSFDFSFRYKLQKKESGISSEKVSKRIFRYLGRYTPYIVKALFKIVSSTPKAYLALRNRYPIVVLGGGQLILSNGSFPSCLLVWSILSKILGSKMVIVSVGAGDKFRILDKFMIKVALRLSSSVHVRDIDSISTLSRELGFRNAQYIPDCVYFLFERVVTTPKKSIVLIAPAEFLVHLKYISESGSSVNTEELYMGMWREVVNQYLREGSKVVLTGTTYADYEFAKQLYSEMNAENSEISLRKVNTWSEFSELSKEASILVSSRMHGLILGQINGVDLLPILVSRKLISFAQGAALLSPVENRDKFIQIFSTVIGDADSDICT